MNTLTEKERQAIEEAAKKYVLSIYRNEYEIERDTISFIAGAEFLAKLLKEEAPSELTTASDISNQLCDKYGLTIDYAPILEDAYELGQIRANSSKICKVNDELQSNNNNIHICRSVTVNCSGNTKINNRIPCGYKVHNILISSKTIISDIRIWVHDYSSSDVAIAMTTDEIVDINNPLSFKPSINVKNPFGDNHVSISYTKKDPYCAVIIDIELEPISTSKNKNQ